MRTASAESITIDLTMTDLPNDSRAIRPAVQVPEVDERRQMLIENLRRSVEELELSVRSYNCLKNARIRSLADLVQRSEGEMLKTRNFGRKSLNEIRDILNGMGLTFGMDFSQLKINLQDLGLSENED